MRAVFSSSNPISSSNLSSSRPISSIRFSLCILCGLVCCSFVAEPAGGQSAGDATRHTGKTAKSTVKSADKGRSVHKPAGVVKRSLTTKKTLPITVMVKPNAEVPQRTFRLGEIADISGGDRSLVAQFAAVEIGNSPLPGLSRIIYSGDIVVHLRAAHLYNPTVEIVAPPEIRVQRASHDIAVEQIVSAARVSAQFAIKDLPDAVLAAEPLNGRYTMPSGKLRLVAGAYRGTVDGGTLIVPVSIQIDGASAQSVDVLFKVHRRMTLLVARRTIEPHDIIAADDVSLKTIELPAGFGSPVREIRDVDGKRATRRILMDTPIPSNALETPPVVLQNGHVTIEYLIGAIRITAPGKALQPGLIGETIRVYALDTRRELDAVVVSKGLVRITEPVEDEPDASTGSQG